MICKSYKLKKRILSSTLFKDSFWALSGSAVGQGLSLVASIFIARMLGKDIFGMYGIVRSTLFSVAAFSTFGLSYTATKFVAEYSKSQPSKLATIIRNSIQITLFTSSILAVLLFIFSHQVAQYLETPKLYNSIRLLAVIVIFNSIRTTQVSILAGFRKFKEMAIINLINGIFTFASSIVLTYFYGLDGALIALFISQIVNCIQNYIELRKTIKAKDINIKDKTSIRKELLSFSLPMAVQEVIQPIFTWVIPILIIKFSNFGEVGLYNAAQQWYAVILFIPGTLRNVILSHISSNKDNDSQQVSILNKMLLINFFATFIPFLVLFFFSSLIEKAYGNTFTSLQGVLNISVLSAIFVCLNNMIRQYFMAVGKVWVSFWVYLGSSLMFAGTFVGLSVFFDDEKSALHMAQSFLGTQITFFIIFYMLFRWYSKGKK